MKKWTVINQHDGNDTFEVEGDNYGEAACDALQQLGWAISIPESDDDEDTPNATAHVRAVASNVQQIVGNSEGDQ